MFRQEMLNFEEPQDLQSSIFETLQNQNTVEPVTDLPAAPNPAEWLGSVGVGTEDGVLTNVPTYNQASSISSNWENALAPPFVLDYPYQLSPSLLNSSAPLQNETQSGYPLSSSVGLFLEGISSIQGNDTAQTGSLNQFSHMQNENLHMLNDFGVSGEHNPINPPLVPNITDSINFNGINQQPFSYPALFQPNPIEAGPGIETHSSGQFITTQASALFPLQNHNINQHTVWNSSRPKYNQFSAPDVYGSQYAPNYMQTPQTFTTQLNQEGYTPEMQKIFDLPSQNSMQPVYPMNSGLETYSNLQPGFVTMTPNTYQHGYGPIVTQPLAPSASSLANYSQQPNMFAITSNSFGSESSVPSMYPPLYHNQDNHQYPQVMLPNVHGQQSVPSDQFSWSQGVPYQINEQNAWMNTPNLQWQSTTLHESPPVSSSFTSSQALNSRILGLSGTTRTGEGTCSQGFNPKEAKIEHPLSVQQVPPVSANQVPTQGDKGKLPESSSTRSQPSAAILRILNMNPKRTVTPCASSTAQQNQNGMATWHAHYEPPRRGRPPKRREPGDSSSQHGKKGSSKPGKTPRSQGARKTVDSADNKDHNANAANPPSAQRQFLNSIYSPKFETKGVPMDPHLRLFKGPPEN